MAIDRQELFKHLDKGAVAPPDAGMPADGGDDYGPEKQLLSAIAQNSPEAVHEALAACYAQLEKDGEPDGDEGE